MLSPQQPAHPGAPSEKTPSRTQKQDIIVPPPFARSRAHAATRAAHALVFLQGNPLFKDGGNGYQIGNINDILELDGTQTLLAHLRAAVPTASIDRVTFECQVSGPARDILLQDGAGTVIPLDELSKEEQARLRATAVVATRMYLDGASSRPRRGEVHKHMRLPNRFLEGRCDCPIRVLAKRRDWYYCTDCETDAETPCPCRRCCGMKPVEDCHDYVKRLCSHCYMPTASSPACARKRKRHLEG